MIWLIIAGSVAAGVALTFAAAWAVDAYRTFRYRFWEQRHLKHRPIVPRAVVRFAVEICDQDWRAVAYDRNGKDVDWDLGEHPMDAVLNVLESIDRQVKRTEAQP